MRISEAARAAGVGVETVRFYEKKGLIAQPPRPTGGGIRVYSREVVERIRFVRQAQDVGFSLREIADLLALRADPGADCADVRACAIEKRDELQIKLDRMTRICGALDELIASCPGGGDVKACTILEAMGRSGGAIEAPPSATNRDEPKGKSQMKTTVLTIEGMHCDGCAQTIEALLTRLPGVRRVDASFDARQARILHDPTASPEADLIAAIAKGGFKAGGHSR